MLHTYNNIAIVYKKQGKYEEALDYYNKALTIKLNKLGEDHPDVASTYNNIAVLCMTHKVNTRKHWTTTTKH